MGIRIRALLQKAQTCPPVVADPLDRFLQHGLTIRLLGDFKEQGRVRRCIDGEGLLFQRYD
jgi:hypothetical protein